jgi:hypothetical protein
MGLYAVLYVEQCRTKFDQNWSHIFILCPLIAKINKKSAPVGFDRMTICSRDAIQRCEVVRFVSFRAYIINCHYLNMTLTNITFVELGICAVGTHSVDVRSPRNSVFYLQKSSVSTCSPAC